MEQVILSGTLYKDAEYCIDKNNRGYTKFTLNCGSNDASGRAMFTQYHCVSYISGYEKMKRGDQAFVTGKLTAKITRNPDGDPTVILSVMVYQMSGGYRTEERKKMKQKETK